MFLWSQKAEPSQNSITRTTMGTIDGNELAHTWPITKTIPTSFKDNFKISETLVGWFIGSLLASTVVIISVTVFFDVSVIQTTSTSLAGPLLTKFHQWWRCRSDITRNNRAQYDYFALIIILLPITSPLSWYCLLARRSLLLHHSPQTCDHKINYFL